ncbi:hypothetical protein [Gordonia caeni]|uniref:DUF5642 domain-containing protein n=1 Tax=Gordonia caeni TaxID=1007097 RepID=A0ABP7P0K8_9ACTN
MPSDEGNSPEGDSPGGNSPGSPDLPSKYHQHAGGSANYDPDAVHPQRPAGTPPPTKKKHRTRNLIFSACGAVLALAVVIGVIAAYAGGTGSSSPQSAPSSTGYQLPPRPADCTDGVPGGRHRADGLESGGVQVPAAALPKGWRTTDEALPLAARAQLVAPRAAEATGTAPVFGLITLPKGAGTDLRAIGDTFLRCLTYLPRYDGTDPLPPVVTNAQNEVTENDVKYVHLAARLSTGMGADRGGDAVYLVVLGTAPTTIAVGIAPLDDENGQKQLQKALSGIQVRAPR